MLQPSIERLFRGAVALVLLALGGCGERTPQRVVFDPDSIPEAYARSTAALAWPGATRAFQITPEGDLTNGDWILRVRPSCDASGAASPRAIAFEERWLPVAHWRRASGAVRWEFEAAAAPESGLPSADYGGSGLAAPRDSGLVVSLEIRATAGTPCTARLDLELAAADSSAPWIAVDAPDSAGPLAWGDRGTRGVVHAWCDAPARGSILRVEWPLAAGATRTLRIVLPAYPAPARALASWARTPHARRMEDARRYWRSEIDRAARFGLADPEVENAIKAALVVLLECRERRGHRWVPIGSLLHYRDVWLRDGARAIEALAVAGRADEARDLADGLLAYQWPPGPFVSQRGQLDGTGHALWAFEQAALRTPGEAAAFADAALRAWRWWERQRAMGSASGLPFGAMQPFADPHDNEQARAQLVGTDAWAIAGYRAAARLLRAAGRAREADSIESARARYASDFAAALARSGSPDVPPSWQNQGRDWGNLNAAYPCGAIAPADPRAIAMAQRVWRVSGGAGLASYATSDSLHSYLGADLATTALLAGMPERADSVLAAMLAWRSASGGAAEIFSRSTRDYGTNAPPHATSAAVLIALVRNGVVYDDDDTLRLTLGARPAWWRGAHIERAPTRWGPLDLRFSRTANQATWDWSGVPVWTALTLPAGTSLTGIPRAPLIRNGDRVVLAPPGAMTARVEIKAEMR